MKKTILLAVALCAVLLTGCGTTGKFVYPSNMRNLTHIDGSKFANKTVAVLPFDDVRNDENYATSIALHWVPLFPYGWVEYDRPGAAAMFLSIAKFDFNASEDLSKAAALSLRRSKLFKDAWFTFGGDKHRADYIFKGEIISTNYMGRMYSYGLSVAGSLLHLLGAPAGNSENRLAVKFSLCDKKDKILWEYSFDRSDKIWQWLYYRMGHDCRGYAKLMEQAMNEAILDLNKNLKLQKTDN